MTTTTAPLRSRKERPKSVTTSQTTDSKSTTRRVPSQTTVKKNVTTAQKSNVTAISKRQTPTLDLISATEQFNDSVKILSTALKSRSKDAAVTSQKTSREGREITTQEDSARQRNVLANQSPNRKTKAVCNDGKQNDKLCDLTADGRDLMGTGEKAILALSCLFQLKEESDAEGRSQLEQGSSILVNKFLGLGFVDLALTELCNSATRLHGLKTAVLEVGGCGLPAAQADRIKLLISVLQKPSKPETGKAASKTIAYHSQILKAILKCRAKIPDIIRISLDPSNENTPCGFILSALRRNLLSKDDAAQHLYSLSQTVLALGDRSIDSATASIVLRHCLRMISLEIRCMWWQLAKHEFDLAKDLWKPFARFITELNQDGIKLSRKEMATVKGGLESLQRRVDDLVPGKVSPTPASALVAVADLADKNGDIETALRLYEQAHSEDGSARLSAVSICCRIARLVLNQSSSMDANRVTSTIAMAVTNLQGPLRGGTSELDIVLADVVRLRRMAAQTLHENLKNDPQNHNTPTKSACFKVIIACSRFFLRYLRSVGNSASILEENEHAMSKVRDLWKPLLSSIDSSITVLRTRAVIDSSSDWEESEQAISDVHQLATCLADFGQNQDGLDVLKTFPKLSNILCCRAQVVDGTDKIGLLKKAINVIQKRPEDEWHNGALPAKYEKLAVLQYRQGAYGEAINAYRLAINTSIDSNTVTDIETLANGGALETSWTSSGEQTALLDRLMSQYARIISKHGSTATISIDGIVSNNLQPLERTTILERLLHHCLLQSTFTCLQDLIIDLAKAILSTYTFEEYPLRRLRVLFRILLHHSKNPKTFQSDFVDELSNEQCIGLHDKEICNDLPLKNYTTYLISCFQLTAAFHLGRPSPELLRATITSWDSLLASIEVSTEIATRVERLDDFLNLINIVIDFTDAMGTNDLTVEALYVEQKVLRLRTSTSRALIFVNETRLAEHLIRMGATQKAGPAILRARQFRSEDQDLLEDLKWHLVSAEHLLQTGKNVECLEALEAAQGKFAALNTSQGSYSSNNVDRTLAYAALITSQVSRNAGQMENAMTAAKQAIKIVLRLWAITEKTVNDQQLENTRSPDASMDIDSLVDKFSALRASSPSRDRFSGPGAAKFWPQVYLHIQCLLNMSLTATHSGLYQDALYFAEQAKKMAIRIGAESHIAQINSHLGDVYIHSGHLDLALDVLQSIPARGEEYTPTLGDVKVQSLLAEVYGLQGETDMALEHSENATAILDIIEKSAKTSLESQPIPTEEKPKAKATTSTKNTATITKATRAAPRGSKNVKAPTTVSKRAVVKKNVETESTRIDQPQLSYVPMSSSLLWQRVNILSAADRINEAFDLLKQPVAESSDVSNLLNRVSLLFLNARNALLNDSVHNILLDSTISWPSREATEAIPNKTSKMAASKVDGTQAKRTRKAKVQEASPEEQQNPQISPLEILAQVMSMLEKQDHSQYAGLSLACLRKLREIEVKTSLLLSATKETFAMPSKQLVHLTHSASVAATVREQIAIEADCKVTRREYLTQWPEFQTKDEESLSISADGSSACADVVDSLPSSWTVISINTSQDKKDLLLGKLRQGCDPFTIRLPVERLNEEDEEAEVFDYESCRAELLDIVSSANTTAHDARGITDKKMKKDWWSRREALDQRLGELLENIENIWLGGFRGIFTAESIDTEGLGEFSQNFHRILDNHLPSRKKKKNPGNQMKVHDSVLELFIGLGDPDAVDLDEAIADLLAFVVDILQFSGERNAYDEIDFDMMTVETMAALREYHGSIEEQESSASDHIILILDKELLCFPWESLPCMRGKSVSRLPSLHTLKLRLDQINGQQQTNKSRSTTHSGLHIDSGSGSYILNPSSDLTATLSTFSEPLMASHPSYNFIASRTPSEPEFLSCLTESDLFLYFGHGSGAQYIRGRSIRRLNQCATTFLMGCSSAQMHEAGEYEPYGVPWNYMHAGAPAVVGTLWDITDKDIDRFSLRALVEWGLLEPEWLTRQEEKEKEKAKGKKKAKGKLAVADDTTGTISFGTMIEGSGGKAARGNVGLGDAVATARDACLFKYLNGAATVWYGVPVFLK